tara:strand:- start:131 stop:601 length:471 start_codon:yes stop_codon:yes gene_type:complete
MQNFKLFIIALFIAFSILTNIAYAESLKFAQSTYEGEVKKGKANGEGIITFSDGSKYEGQVKKNKIHGNGKYIDLDSNIFEGRFSLGKYKIAIDKKTRQIIELDVDNGYLKYFEIKGKGKASKFWFEAKKTSSEAYEFTDEGKIEMKIAQQSAGGC